MAPESVRYYALTGISRGLDNPYTIFREIHDSRGMLLERLDNKDPNRWVRDNDLGKYIFRGEPGAEEITEEEAKRFVEQRGGTLAPP